MLMMKNDGFHGLETVDKPKWTSERQFRCADAQWLLGNDSQNSSASLKQLSSKSNNVSDLDACQDKPSLGTKESCPRTSGHPTSRIRSLSEGKVCAHEEK